MKFFKILSLISVVSLLIFLGCSKSNDRNETTNVNNASKFLSDNVEMATQTFTVNLNSPNTYIDGAKGTRITISSNSFKDASGNIVAEDIDFELIEAQTNEDMLLLGLPTVTDNGELLVSGGVIYVNATQNGNPLSINSDAPLRASIPTESFANQNMQFFTGSENSDGFSWDSIPDTNTITPVVVDSGYWDYGYGFDSSYIPGMSYNLEIDGVGWINCDYFWNSQASRTDIEVFLPSDPNGVQYDASNSVVYMYFTNVNSTAKLYDYHVPNVGYNGIFVGSNFPNGLSVNFVVISEVAGQWSYHVSAPITLNGTNSVPHVEMIPASSMLNANSSQDVSAQIQALL